MNQTGLLDCFGTLVPPENFPPFSPPAVLSRLTQSIDRLLGFPVGETIESRYSFGAEWAHDRPGLVLLGCVLLCGLSVVFYLRWQNRGRKRMRLGLAVLRGLALSLLLVTLADPIRERTYVSHPKPVFWLVVDDTDSMDVADELPTETRERFSAAVDLPAYLEAKRERESVTSDASGVGTEAGSLRHGVGTESEASGGNPTRADYVRALLTRKNDNPLDKLSEKFRLRAYAFRGIEGVVPLALTDEDNSTDTPIPQTLAAQLTGEGEVTAVGNALSDLARRHTGANLGGVLVISDFDQNSGQPPASAAQRIGAPVHTLGVGPRTALDLAVDLEAPLKMKKDEQSTITATLTQQELTGRDVAVRVVARRIGDAGGGVDAVAEAASLQTADAGEVYPVGEKTVVLTAGVETVEFPFTPEKAGRFKFTVFAGSPAAADEPLSGEIVDQNNRAERESTVIDDYMRLLYVAFEPTWEWRFIKEVFHRDRLVGLRGFRTFLRSADPRVKTGNDLFLTSLTQPRSEFFKNDVVFLGDMPASALNTRFCEMTKEFVGNFGGGLVVIAGPRFGPAELADTPLADMLPVVVDPDARLRDEQAYRLRLTPFASEFDFMNLGETPEDNARAWGNLGKLPWYHRVRRVEPGSTTVLAEHPTAFCDDGRTPQPLIAVRRYGRGEVVYVAHNEMWRLRRLYGERYYRQFWGQMIHRLGLSHALGAQKRFVVRTDRRTYRTEDKALLTVEAYDEDFEPLAEADVPDGALQAELIRPDKDAVDGNVGVDGDRTAALSVSQLKPGVFETTIPLYAQGEYRVRVTDPVSKEPVEVHFNVTGVSLERRSAVRNASLQQSIAVATDGATWELDTIDGLYDQLNPPELTETTTEIRPLWNTWPWFAAFVVMLLSEWYLRKRVNLV